MPPLRVMTFLHSFEPGGVERVALRLLGAWRAHGIAARLVIGRETGVMRAEWPEQPYHSLALPHLDNARFETLWMILRLPGVIRRQRPDVLFCAGNTYAVVAATMKLLLGRDCPPIVAKVSNDLARFDLIPPARAAYRLWLRIQGRLIDRFVGMAEPMRAEIAAAMRVAHDRIAIIDDPAISESEIAALARPRSPGGAGTRYLAIGRLVPQKNFALLVEAFAGIAAPDDRLTILGEGPERAVLGALVDRLGIADQVALPGHCAAVADALREHDVFVLSSDYEGVPAVVIEALAAGLPIVATDCSASMASLLDGGRLGELVPPRSRWSLEQAMQAARRHSVDTAAARRQARRFTIERAAGTYASLFHDLYHTRHVFPDKISDVADAIR